MSLADEILLKLLRRGERARVRGGPERAISERFQNIAHPYWGLSLAERDAFHARIMAAEEFGAVYVLVSIRGGEDRPLEAVSLASVDALAEFLGRPTVDATVRQATRTLAQWAQRYPQVGELLDRWGSLKAPRGIGPEGASDIVDALKVIEAAQACEEDAIVRVLSVALFRDSKRIEGLVRHLDLLTAESLSAPAREWPEVFGSLGLIKEPQPMLFAGEGEIEVKGHNRTRIVPPYLGVANHAVEAYSGSPRWVLTIENLTTFHTAARMAGRHDGLIVYSGGMPSPHWCGAYVRVVAGLPGDVPCYHWGDIDLGGFRIAARIRRALPASRKLLPWMMDARSIGEELKPMSGSARNAMARAAKAAGWDELAEGMAELGGEQEGLRVKLPRDS